LAGYGCGVDRDATQHAKRRCCSPSIMPSDTPPMTHNKPVLPLYVRRAATSSRAGRAAAIGPTAISPTAITI
jgi:hypothetical protein